METLGLQYPVMQTGMNAAVVDRAALYAGETIHRISDIVPATDTVARLAPDQRHTCVGGRAGRKPIALFSRASGGAATSSCSSPHRRRADRAGFRRPGTIEGCSPHCAVVGSPTIAR